MVDSIVQQLNPLVTICVHLFLQLDSSSCKILNIMKINYSHMWRKLFVRLMKRIVKFQLAKYLSTRLLKEILVVSIHETIISYQGLVKGIYEIGLFMAIFGSTTYFHPIWSVHKKSVSYNIEMSLARDLSLVLRFECLFPVVTNFPSSASFLE